MVHELLSSNHHFFQNLAANSVSSVWLYANHSTH
jgi:hypothetical protein